ncbi:MAG: TlpA family protein disulfide reductase [Chitinophagales bacterium]
MKSTLKNSFLFLSLCLLNCFQYALGQQTYTIPTWQFTPPKVVTSVPVQKMDKPTTNVELSSKETYEERASKAEDSAFYPYSNKHYKFLKVVPEGASAQDYLPNTFYEEGETLPDIQLPNKNGMMANLSETRGKYTLVHFWASWCPTSMVKVPHYQTLYEKYGATKFANANGFEVFAISLDKEQKDWQRAIDENKLSWKYNTTTMGIVGETVVDDLNVDIIPASYLLDPNGVIIGKNMCESVLDYTLSKRTKLAKDNFLAAKKQHQIPNSPTAAKKPESFGRLANYQEANRPVQRRINHRVELGVFKTLDFHDFSHIEHLGKMYQEPGVKGGIRVLIGDYANVGVAVNAAKELIGKGYYNSHIVTYRFENAVDDSQFAEQVSEGRNRSNIFNP